MTDEEKQMLRELHDFWMKPSRPGKPSRADKVDQIFTAVEAGKIGARFVLWACGFIAAVGAAWAAIKGFRQ